MDYLLKDRVDFLSCEERGISFSVWSNTSILSLTLISIGIGAHGCFSRFIHAIDHETCNFVWSSFDLFYPTAFGMMEDVRD